MLKPLNPVSSDSTGQTMTERERLYLALRNILPDGTFDDWLHASNAAFEGRTPLQIIERGDAHRLWWMISQYEAGVAN